MQKVQGVENVRVSLKDGLTILELKPGNTITLATLRQVIKNNGFVSKEARVTARGAVLSTGGRIVFDTSGTRERLEPEEKPLQAGAPDEWRFVVAATSRR